MLWNIIKNRLLQGDFYLWVEFFSPSLLCRDKIKSILQKKIQLVTHYEFKLSVFLYVLKSSYDDVITVIDESFDQWDPSPATPMEEVC